MRLYTQIYLHPQEKVSLIINETILSNAKQPHISEIIAVCEADAKPPAHPKIRSVPTDKRADFALMLQIAGDDSIHRSSPFCIANSDIELSDTAAKASHSLASPNSAIALCRHEANGDLYTYPKWSQDCWIFANHKPTKAVIERSKFDLGVAGCESMFAMALFTHGYNIWNPCLDVNIKHRDPKPQSAFIHRYYGAYLLLPPCQASVVEVDKPQYEIMIKTYSLANCEPPYPR
jgi:hypothetical protein